MIDAIFDILSYTFFQNALLASLLIAIAGSMIGTYTVTRRMVFLSSGISHASFGGVGLAWYLGLNPIVGAAFFALFSALGIEWITNRQNIRMDSSIGILWSMGMATGIIFVFLTPGYAPNLMSFLFGNILTVTSLDISLLAIVTIVLALFFTIFYRTILYISHDALHARTRKIPVDLISTIMLALLALTIVFAIKIVGIILIVAMLTIPQATANIISKNFKGIILWSMLIGIIGNVIGLFVSYALNIPSGASIIFVHGLIFAIVRFSYWLSEQFQTRLQQ